eukprot:6707959-Pyramimonas_sp.AAC.1
MHPSDPPDTMYLSTATRAVMAPSRWMRRIFTARRSEGRDEVSGALLPSSHSTTSPSTVPVTAISVPGMKTLTVKSPMVCLKSLADTGGE